MSAFPPVEVSETARILGAERLQELYNDTLLLHESVFVKTVKVECAAKQGRHQQAYIDLLFTDLTSGGPIFGDWALTCILEMIVTSTVAGVRSVHARACMSHDILNWLHHFRSWHQNRY